MHFFHKASLYGFFLSLLALAIATLYGWVVIFMGNNTV